MKKFVLIGAGGHAKSVVEAAASAGYSLDCYIDPHESSWLGVFSSGLGKGLVTTKAAGANVPCGGLAWPDARHISEDELRTGAVAGAAVVILGIGGVNPAGLEKRLALLDTYLRDGMKAPPVQHAASSVSPRATLAEGAIVLAGAAVQAGASIGRGVIINTRAIVEHDSTIGAGSHVAPGAIVLGGCRIGSCCMIGAGAVILPGTTIADDSLVPAGTRYPS